MFRTPTITSQGKTLHLKALTGKILKFTTIRMGSGIVEASDNPSVFTELKNETVKMDCTSATHSLVDGVANLQCTFYNNVVEEGFNWTECGIFAEDPDSKEEVLYAYTYTSKNESQFIPPSEAEVVEKVITIPIDIEGCDKIEFIVSSSNLFVTLDKFHKTVEGLKAENVPTVEELPNADAPTAPGAVIANARLYIKI